MDAAYQAFLNNLAVYEFNMGKIQVVADTSARDAQAYGEQQVQLKAEMERTEVQVDCPRRPSARGPATSRAEARRRASRISPRQARRP